MTNEVLTFAEELDAIHTEIQRKVAKALGIYDSIDLTIPAQLEVANEIRDDYLAALGVLASEASSI